MIPVQYPLCADCRFGPQATRQITRGILADNVDATYRRSTHFARTAGLAAAHTCKSKLAAPPGKAGRWAGSADPRWAGGWVVWAALARSNGSPRSLVTRAPQCSP